MCFRPICLICSSKLEGKQKNLNFFMCLLNSDMLLSCIFEFHVHNCILIVPFNCMMIMHLHSVAFV